MLGGGVSGGSGGLVAEERGLSAPDEFFTLGVGVGAGQLGCGYEFVEEYSSLEVEKRA